MMTSKDREKYAEVLKGVAPFAEFSSEELSTLIEAGEPKVLAPREPLWAVGSREDSMYILLEGRIEQIQRHPPDRQQVRQYSRPGCMLGLSYLVKGWRHQSSAVAQERTTLLRLHRSEFEKMFARGELVAFRLTDEIAENLVQEMRDANRRIQEVFGNPAETLRTLRRRVRTT